MYELGDLVWIPQGSYLMRKRNESDNLFSNAEVAVRPTIGVYVGATTNKSYRKVMIGDTFYEVREKEIRHYVEKRTKLVS